jgi:hypothetical protein
LRDAFFDLLLNEKLEDSHPHDDIFYLE